MLRVATIQDASSILAIYRPFILNTGVTQEVSVPSAKDFSDRIEKGLDSFPWLVEEVDGKICGYAYAARHRERAGYQWCVETSIYLSGEARGTGVGFRLYNALFALLLKLGYVNAYAVITLPNPASIRFHEKCGFTHFTTFEKVGFKLGQWHDVAWMIRQIQSPLDDPLQPLRFVDLDPLVVQSILNEAAQSAAF